MLMEPACHKRKCKNFIGVKWFGNQESSENNLCKAFPDGIPEDIAYGDNLHLTQHPDQKNNIVFEKSDD